MRQYAKEMELAKLFTNAHSFEGLSAGQWTQIQARGRILKSWSSRHWIIHYIIGIASILLLLAADIVAVLWLPSLFLTGVSDSAGTIIFSAILIGCIRGWLIYAILAFSIHETSTHDLTFPRMDGMSNFLNRVVANVSRLYFTDPGFYRPVHLAHHAHFGTHKDGELLNFILPRRFWLSLIPLAMFFNYGDFFAHRPEKLSHSYILSIFCSLLYHGALAYWVAIHYEIWFYLIIFVVAAHVTFYLDRLRQYSEHNLMPLKSSEGSRSFGLGFWGMLVGGGPWGSPCHWEHHLMPDLPWYQTLVLHSYLKKILSPAQKSVHLLRPFIGYPQLLWRLWTEPNRFSRSVSDVPRQH